MKSAGTTQKKAASATRPQRYGRGDSAASSSASQPSSGQVFFCVSPILFENCGLLLEPPSGITTASIMKLRQESYDSTSLSLSEWSYLAVKVLGLRESTAFSVFDVVFSLSGGCMQGAQSYNGNYAGSERKTVAEFRQESNRALLYKMGGAVDEEQWPVASASRLVSFPCLLIFLHAQMLLERSPRSPLGELSPDVIMDHVQQYLLDYITAVAATRQGRVTIADILELRVLLREFLNGVEQPFGTSLGFLWPRNEKTIDIAILSQFIRPRIVRPEEVAASAATGAPGVKPFANNIVISHLQNTVCIPPPSTFPEGIAKLMSSNCTIDHCQQTRFYVTQPLPHVRLSLLSNCTVALGPVSGVLCVDRCSNCNISALCGAIVISNCTDSKFFICTNTPPVLTTRAGSQSNVNVRLAPYNSYYSTLEEHLAMSGISPKLNLWNAGLPSPQYVLPPEEFAPICFPVAPQTTAIVTTRTNPCELPPVYEEALQQRLELFQKTSGNLHEAYVQLESAGRRDLADSLRSKVHAMFIEWLHANGQSSGLLDLVRSKS